MKTKWTSATHDAMEESHKHVAELHNPATESHTLYDLYNVTYRNTKHPFLIGKGKLPLGGLGIDLGG